MREYKFRGKAVLSVEELDQLGLEHENGWVFGNLIDGATPLIVGGIAEAGEDFIAHEFFVNVLPESVGQFVGKKDTNGREVYDKDVLTSKHYPYQKDGEYNYHSLVEWDEEQAAYYLTKYLANKNRRGVSHLISDSMEQYDMATFEVIGNITDNPELLGVKPNEV